MDVDVNANFFTLLDDAVATLRADARDEDPTRLLGASSLDPTVPSVYHSGWYYDRNSDRTINWTKQFSYYLDMIRGGKASWGFVDDWDVAGSPFKRRGIIVELYFDVTTAFLKGKSSDCQDNQEYIRMAISLVMLLIASDPNTIKPFLMKGTGVFDTEASLLYEDELDAMTRGVPWELQVRFTYRSINTAVLLQKFQAEFMVPYDTQPMDSFSAKRLHHVVQDLVDRKCPRLERLARLASRSVVSATLVIYATDKTENSVLASEDFFEFLRMFIADLDRFQSRLKPRQWTKLAPFRVEKIQLELGRMHITPRVLRSSTALMRARIPVQSVGLTLDFRLIASPEQDFRKFIQVVAAGATQLAVDTGENNNPKEARKTTDAEGQDRTNKIRTFLSAISDIQNLWTLDLAGILWMCASPVNREAVWRGLFEDVLSGDRPTETMTLSIGIMKPRVIFTEHDAKFISESAVRWHNANPHKKLRLRHVELHVYHTDDMSAVRALFSSFDDVEHVTLDMYTKSTYGEPPTQALSSEDVVAMLRYPSLQSVYLKGVSIPTMDVFNPRIVDPQLPVKAILRKLRLSRFQLEDPTSFHRFLDQLNQTPPSSLAKKLQHLMVEWVGSIPVIDRTVLPTIDEFLTSNTPLVHMVFSVAGEDQSMARKMIKKHTQRIVPVSSADESSMAKARKLAFLSAINDRSSDGRTTAARFDLDTTLVSRIFAFSATRAVRTVETKYCW